MDHWPKFARNSEIPLQKYNHSAVLYDKINCTLTPFFDNKTGCIIMPPKLKEVYTRYVDSGSMFVSLKKGFCVFNNNVELLSFKQMKIFDPVSALYGFHKLKVLDISMLGMFFQANLLRDMPALEIFLSPGNKLNIIEKDPEFGTLFFKNRNLKFVDFSNNDLSFLPADMISRNPLLEIIDLSMNMLMCINLNLSANVHLKTLDLKQNRIKIINPILMDILENLVVTMNSTIQLNLQENDLVCDCDNIEFVHWIITTTTELVNRSELLCNDKDSVINKFMDIDTVHLEESCLPGSELAPYIILSLILAALVLVIITVIC